MISLKKPILIINSAPFTKEFVNPIIDLFSGNNLPHQLVNYNDIPDDKNQFSGIIISASPRGDDIIDEQLPYYKWLLNYEKPVIGSCHGHQLTGVLFGSKIKINTEAEEGWFDIRFEKADGLFDGLIDPYKVEQHHIKSITLPVYFNLLASSDKCKNQIMKHNKKPFYGCQFHIESAPHLLMNFVEVCCTLSK